MRLLFPVSLIVLNALWKITRNQETGSARLVRTREVTISMRMLGAEGATNELVSHFGF